MSKKSDNIEHKFIESYDINDFEIMTDDGWKDCKAIHKTVVYDIWELKTKRHSLKCADNHIVFDSNMHEIFVKDLNIGQLIQTEDGLDEVIEVIKTNSRDNMYDVELDDNSNHRYFTNGILSHNTTAYTVFVLWLSTLFQEKKILICANKLQTSIEIMDRIRRAYEQLPFWIKPGVLVYNKSEITFSNMSSIKAFSTSSSGARGSSGNVIIIDEMGFIPKNIIDDFFASVMPIISSSKKSKAIVVSTPNGASGLYYDLWQEALQNQRNGIKDGWQPFRIHWWDTGGIRDEAWKRQQIASIGIERWKQEYECDFLTSSSKKLIPDDIIDNYRMKLSEYKVKEFQPKKQKIASPNEDALFEFDMWHEFDPQRTYLASADISEGIGGDSSVLYIWDVTDLSNIKMCAKFSSNTTSLVQFAYVASKMLALYNNPWLAAERNGVSAGMLDSLRITYGYSNIASENKKKEPGIYSHITVKERACLWARDMMTTSCFGFTLYDKDLFDELSIFVKKDSTAARNIYHAMPGPNSHDDHVMAFIWGLYLLHNDRVNDYFIVADSFTTALNQTYAHLLEPLNAYTQAQLNIVTNDPLYKEFIEHKQEAMKRNKELLEAYKKDDANDVFKYEDIDPYFGDSDDGSWNNTSLNWNMKPGFQQNIQKNIQLGISRGASTPSFFVI